MSSKLEHASPSPAINWWPWIGAILLWLAFPPCGWWWLAPLGIACWVRPIAAACPPSRRDYWVLYLAGFLLWLGLLQGIRLAYWPLYAGWIALSAYLAIYVPLFVTVSRIGVHRFRLPLLIVGPIVWVGLECFRSYFLTGFAGCLLGHSFASVPILIQSAEHFGAYGVSASIVLLGITLARLASLATDRKHSNNQLSVRFRSAWKSIAIGILLYGLVVLYGGYSLSIDNNQPKQVALRVALIQDNSPTMFEANPQLRIQSWDSYLAETRRALQSHNDIDVIVWPESVFTRNEPIFEWTTAESIPPEFGTEVRSRTDVERAFQRAKDEKLDRLLQATRIKPSNGEPISNSSDAGPHFLVGSDVLRATKEGLRVLNAVLWISPQGTIDSYYAKQHLVMFGEYLPLGHWIQPLLGMGIVLPGDKPEILERRGVRIAPSICFENMVPHGIHRMLTLARQQGKDPDILINVSNDGWFHGSSMLDHHLACATMTAVENRRPMLVAANTGLSAWIDSSGRQIAVTKRLTTDHILAEPYLDHRIGLWQRIGDWPARLCTLGTVLLAGFGFRRRRAQVASNA